MSTTSALTLARRAVLDAIDRSELLADPSTVTGRAFAQIYKYEDDNNLIEDTGHPPLGELPCLDVRWASNATPQWLVNRETRVMFTVELRIYSHGNNVVTAEGLLMRTLRAVFQTGPNGTVRTAVDGDTYVGAATGYAPEIVGFQPPQTLRLASKVLATLTIVRLGLAVQFDPFSE